MTEITEADLEPVTLSVRLPKGLVEKVDTRAERVAAARGVKVSRNQWLTEAISYVIEQLPTDAPVEARQEARRLWLAGEL